MYQKGTLTVYHAINSGTINLLTVSLLFDEVVMETYFPEMTLNPPSISFSMEDLDKAHKQLISKSVSSVELAEMNGNRNFDFADEYNKDIADNIIEIVDSIIDSEMLNKKSNAYNKNMTIF